MSAKQVKNVVVKTIFDTPKNSKKGQPTDYANEIQCLQNARDAKGMGVQLIAIKCPGEAFSNIHRALQDPIEENKFRENPMST